MGDVYWSDGHSNIKAVSSGDAQFDQDFYVYSNNKSMQQLLVANSGFRQLCHLLGNEDHSAFLIWDRINPIIKFPKNTFQFCFMTLYSEAVLQQFDNLYKAFTEGLLELCKIGLASEDGVNYEFPNAY